MVRASCHRFWCSEMAAQKRLSTLLRKPACIIEVEPPRRDSTRFMENLKRHRSREPKPYFQLLVGAFSVLLSCACEANLGSAPTDDGQEAGGPTSTGGHDGVGAGGGQNVDPTGGNGSEMSGSGGGIAVRDPGEDPQLYLLTHIELRNSLLALLSGEPLQPDEVQPDRSVAGFAATGAGEHSLSSLGVERLEAPSTAGSPPCSRTRHDALVWWVASQHLPRTHASSNS